MDKPKMTVEDLNKTVEGLVTTVQDLVTTVHGPVWSFGGVQEPVRTFGDPVVTTETRMNSLETRMNSLETTVQELVTRMDALETAHTVERTAVGECCVCMETMADESYRPYLVTPGCGNRKHLFHLQCGRDLISRHIPCPLCRTPIQTLFKMWVRRPHPTPGAKTL
jgi:hypothetical protein